MGSPVARDWCVGVSRELHDVVNALYNNFDGALKWVVDSMVMYDGAFDCIFLICQSHGG